MESAACTEISVNRVNKRIYIAKLLILIALGLFFALKLEADECAGAAENYFNLRSMFITWDTGFTGSKTRHRKRLNRFLADMIGCQIKTDYDFLIDPALFDGSTDFSSDIIYNDWLYIHGEMDPEQKKGDIPGYEKLLKERVISKTLFAVSGRIMRFRIVESFRGRSVHLYLERLRIEPAQKHVSLKQNN